jgi:hypothetical protein
MVEGCIWKGKERKNGSFKGGTDDEALPRPKHDLFVDK